MLQPGCPLNRPIIVAFQVTKQPAELENNDIALTLRWEAGEWSKKLELRTRTIGTGRRTESHSAERGRQAEASCEVLPNAPGSPESVRRGLIWDNRTNCTRANLA